MTDEIRTDIPKYIRAIGGGCCKCDEHRSGVLVLRKKGGVRPYETEWEYGRQAWKALERAYNVVYGEVWCLNCLFLKWGDNLAGRGYYGLPEGESYTGEQPYFGR